MTAVNPIVRSEHGPELLVVEDLRVVVDADPLALVCDQLEEAVLLERERDELVERVPEHGDDHEQRRREQYVRRQPSAPAGREPDDEPALRPARSWGGQTRCSRPGTRAYEAFRICVMRSLACFASSCVLPGFRRMPLSMLWSTFALSTFAQFGVAGTNQLAFAASANGASVGLEALILASVVVFGITPPLTAIVVMLLELVKAAIQSAASALSLLVTGTPRTEPPRKVGMNCPFVWLGIG